ncbi:Kelch repeat-containing protein [Myxococcus virescens]|nr:kelch repeat-containing protein [Myxococcus virescens]
MKPLRRSTALGLLVLSVHLAACLDVDEAVDQFCNSQPGACLDDTSDAGPDGNGSLDGGNDGGGPDGEDGGPHGGGDGGSDAGTDGGPPDAGREPPGWKSVAPMQTRRTGHTATALKNGRVLVVGGSSSGNTPTNTTELYTVASNSWSPGPDLGTARMDHTATLLPNGKVLVVGGRGPGGDALNSAEIYDVNANEWIPASPIPLGARASHAAVLLPSGEVLVAGGGNSHLDGLNTSALYHLKTDSWTDAGSMNVKRNVLTLTLLEGGVVVAIGGFNAAGAETTAEVYASNQPEAGWIPLLAQMEHGRHGHASTLLPSGRILVTGSLEGSPGRVLKAAEIFHWSSTSWTYEAEMLEARFFHTATALPSGEVLIAGGYSSPHAMPRASAEIFRRDGSWEFIAPMSSARVNHTATWLESGSVLIIGGSDGAAVLNTAERYVP